MSDGKPAGVGSLMKTLDILEAVAESSEGPTVASLALELGLPRATAHRISLALESRGYLRVSPTDKTLHLGPNLFDLARKAWADVDLRAVAIDPMRSLAKAASSTVVLAIRAGDQIVVIDKIAQGTVDRLPAIGESIPIEDTVLGIAVLSASQHGPLLPFEGPRGGGVISNADALRYAAQLANARGYALKTGPGADTMVAAPVVDAFGNAIAVIGITPPAENIREDDLHRLAPMVMDAARRIRSDAGVWLKPTKPHPKPALRSPTVGTCLSNPQLLLPRSAIFLPGRSMIAMVDVMRPAFTTYELNDGTWTVHRKEALAGALAIRGDGTLVIADQRGLWEFREPEDFDNRKKIAESPSTVSHSRFNAGTAAPDGSIWFGMMDLDVRHGAGDIWRLSGGDFVPLGLGLTTPSGIGFSHDGSRAYIVDSERHELFCIELDAGGLPSGKPRSIAKFRPTDGKPDALAIDRNGNLWVTFWDGWRVEQFDQYGQIMNRVNLPVPRASGICLDETNGRMFLMASSARLSQETLNEYPASGGLLEAPL